MILLTKQVRWHGSTSVYVMIRICDDQLLSYVSVKLLVEWLQLSIQSVHHELYVSFLKVDHLPGDSNVLEP